MRATKTLIARTAHGLIEAAFGALRDRARKLGVTLKQVAKADNYSGKVLRRGTKTDRRGYKTPGNSRQRRFARRHPQHFNAVAAL